ncbi:aspartate/glutamate racemase family protein [Desulfonatronum parangueonense]
MKTIGLLGGMSWESTATYYQLLNQQVKAKLGGFHSAKIILHSVDFHDIEKEMRAGDWDRIGEHLAAAAKGLEDAGAEILLLCTNTIHKIAPRIEEAISIPFLHIADATAQEIKRCGLDTVGLLGTKFTMEEPFLIDRFRQLGINILTPITDHRETVHRIIFEELCLGKITQEAKKAYMTIISEMEERGAQGVILGCTEIGSLISQQDSSVPLFDTTFQHVNQAIEFMMKGD